MCVCSGDTCHNGEAGTLQVLQGLYYDVYIYQHTHTCTLDSCGFSIDYTAFITIIIPLSMYIAIVCVLFCVYVYTQRGVVFSAAVQTILCGIGYVGHISPSV